MDNGQSGKPRNKKRYFKIPWVGEVVVKEKI